MPNVMSKLPLMISDEEKIDARYQKCKIYMLRHQNDVNNHQVYIGHTIKGLNERWKQHCWDIKNMHYKKSEYIKNNGGIDNWKLELIEDYPCNNFHIACIREQYWIKQFSASLNQTLPGRNLLQYREDNRNELIKKSREYYNVNKKIILQKQSIYNRKQKIKRNRTITCDCGDEISWSNSARHRKSKRHQKLMQQSLITPNSVNTVA